MKQTFFGPFLRLGSSRIGRLRSLGLLSCILVLFACAKSQIRTYPEKPYQTEPPVKSSPAPSPAKPPSVESPLKKLFSRKTYSETVSEWKSYQDLVRWMEKEFSLDADRFNKFGGTLPPPRSPEETFQLKSGIYIDATLFAKETLNRIKPSYKARVAILLIRPGVNNHYICTFQSGGKLFTMDYGTPFKGTTGTRGPYNSLGEVKKFYEQNFPVKGHIEAISYLSRL